MFLNSGFKIIFLISLALILMIWVSTYKIDRVLSENQIVNIPHLQGMDVLEATQKIELLNRNLSQKICLNIRSVLNDKYLKYTVIKQNPKISQQNIKSGRNITISVSKGYLNPKIPNYIGKPLKLVRRELHSSKSSQYPSLKKVKLKINSILKNQKYSSRLKVKKIQNFFKKLHPSKNSSLLALGQVAFVHSDTVPRGQIIHQDPKPGQAMYEDIDLNFVVSLGPKDYILTKNYVGYPIEMVSKELTDRNIVVKLKTVPVKYQKFQGQVISQSVGVGKKLYPGDEILFKVPAGPLAHYKLLKFVVPQYIRHSNIRQKNSYQVRLEIQNSKGLVQVAFDGIRKIGQLVHEVVKISDQTKVRVWLDGQLYQTYSL